MHKLIEYVCDELEELEKKAEREKKLSMTELQYADTLAHLKKNLLKGEEMMEEEYSNNSYARGRSYGYDDMSYARGDGRGRGSRANRDRMGRYSSEMGYSRDDDIMADLKEMMKNAPESKKREIRRMIDEM